jgi:hypothetical protein
MLTKSGLGALVVAVILLGLGVWWNYEELIIGATGIAVLVAFAIWASQRPFRARVTRRLSAVRVPGGQRLPIPQRPGDDHRPLRRAGVPRAGAADRAGLGP